MCRLTQGSLKKSKTKMVTEQSITQAIIQAVIKATIREIGISCLLPYDVFDKASI